MKMMAIWLVSRQNSSSLVLSRLWLTRNKESLGPFLALRETFLIAPLDN